MHDLQPLRQFFDSGATRPYEWRRQQLQKMQQLILDNEKEILASLYTDLKKSPEEAYGSETGLVLSEIRYMLKHLAGWMRPRRVRTNLVNWPSSSTIYRDPLGVVLIIAPWNYPLQLSEFRRSCFATLLLTRTLRLLGYAGGSGAGCG